MPRFSGESSGAIADAWRLPERPPGGAAPTFRAFDPRAVPPLPPIQAEISTWAPPRGGSGGFSIHLGDESRGTRPNGRSRRSTGRGDDPAGGFPAIGSVVGGFRLVAVLGRGSFAQVYRAEEVDLAGRPVALKVSRAFGDEPQTLARLQHTHIVPIYSARDDPSTGLRLLCMPYFGGANLAEILRSTGACLPSRATGRSLVDALDRLALPTGPGGPGTRNELASVGSLLGVPARPSPSIFGRALARLDRRAEAIGANSLGPALTEAPGLRYLGSHSFVESAVWIAARLAEALEHAHSRGFLHRDLKPSNILIAADGTPMLLDFNLSADLGRAGAEDDARAVGGTIAYMAPEHIDAFNPIAETPAEAVDARSDLYSLGLILFEMIAGELPFSAPDPSLRTTDALLALAAERRAGAPSVRDWNPGVSPGLDAILRKCLQPDPARRYQRAADLAEDLRRHLDDRPLKFAVDRDPRERLRKWSRRHPRASGAGTILGFAVAAVVLVGLAAVRYRDGLESASARLRFDRFQDAFGRCQLLLNTSSGPRDHVARGLALADQALAEYRVDQAGVDWMALPSFLRLSASERTALREEIAELLLLEARARVAISGRGRSEAARGRALREAVRRLGLAERIDPHPSVALFEDRARDLAALGEAEAARRDRGRAASIPPVAARDHYLMGTAALAEGDRDRAESLLGRAVALDPRRFWAWFALGLCHLEQGRSADASGDFAACTVIAPEFSWPHLNRGIALARSGRLIEALAAYDRALALEPDLAEARVNRALGRLERDDPAGALADLDRVLPALPRTDPAPLAARAEALARLGRRAEAERDFAEALRVRPNDPMIRTARGFSRIATDPASASDDFAAVLSRDPRHGRAHLGRAILGRASDPRAALKDADAALGSLPGDPDALTLRALLRARVGDESALADVDAILLVPTPHRLYNAACALAILSDSTRSDRHLTRARQLLDRALASGFDRAAADRDPDLAPLRSPGRRDLDPGAVTR